MVLWPAWLVVFQLASTIDVDAASTLASMQNCWEELERRLRHRQGTESAIFSNVHDVTLSINPATASYGQDQTCLQPVAICTSMFPGSPVMLWPLFLSLRTPFNKAFVRIYIPHPFTRTECRTAKMFSCMGKYTKHGHARC